MRRIRLLAPVGVAGAIALGAWVPSVTSASAGTPNLPLIAAGQLIAKAKTADVKGFSGTVNWTANLGLPSISGLTGVGGQGGNNAFDPASLLSGSHDISVWDGGANQQRLALPGSLSEVDVVHNGNHLYYFDSSTMKVTDFTGAAGSGQDAPAKVTGTELTPDQAAQKLLANITPSTDVSVGTSAYVAGQAAYQLVLIPKAADSTVGSVTIAVDAATGMPLQVQVTPRGSSTVALSLGFTDLTYGVPSASNFAAPQGTSTTTKTLNPHSAGTAPTDTATTDTGSQGSRPTSVGTDWSTIGVFHLPSGKASGQLNEVATSVSGTWGSGKVVTSNLLNALILPDGRVLAGFVTPSALEAAVSSAG